jgi:hypothetical protein
MRVLAFPSDDKEFVAFVQRTFEELAAGTPAALEEAIGRSYPAVSVQPRHPLAEFSESHRDQAWYVFRDGILVSEPDPGPSEGLLNLESA